MPWFVYTKGLRGPEPQIIHDDSVLGVDGKKEFLCKREISAEVAKWPIEDIVFVYPYTGGDNATGK